MATTIHDTGITFPNGTVQTVAAVVPTNISAFTNNANYATTAQAGGSISGNCNCQDINISGGQVTLTSVSGSNLGTAHITVSYNCNCACACNC